jgi:hypothetical protein
MEVFGPEIDVGLDGAEVREIMRVLAAGREKRPTIPVIDNHWRLPGGHYLLRDGSPRELFHGDFNAPNDQHRFHEFPDLRPKKSNGFSQPQRC